MQHPMFDNTFSPDSPRERLDWKQLTELYKKDPQLAVNYGKLRCNETVDFFPCNLAKILPLPSRKEATHVFITCFRNDEFDYLWMGQFSAINTDHELVYSQIPGDNHDEKLMFLAEKTIVTSPEVSEYDNHYDGCPYKYAKILRIV